VANHSVAITSCTLSVLGSAFIIFTILILPEKRKSFHMRLVLYLSINDFIQAFLHGADHSFNLAEGYVVPGGVCQAAGWWIGTFLVGNVAWMIILVYYLHKLIVRQKQNHIPEVIIVLLGWTIPNYHLIPLIQFDTLSYGPRGNWCYILDSQPVWQSVFLAIPTYLGFFIVSLLYSHIAYTIGKVGRDVEKYSKNPERVNRRWKYQRRFLGYPVIFLIQWLPLVIEFAEVWGGASLYAITITDIFTVAFINASGIMNCLWLAYNEKLWKRYKALFFPDGDSNSTSSAGSRGSRSFGSTDTSL